MPQVALSVALRATLAAQIACRTRWHRVGNRLRGEWVPSRQEILK